MSFAEHLVASGVVSRGDLERAERHRAQSGVSLVAALRHLALADGASVAGAMAAAHGLPLAQGIEWPRSLQFAGALSRSFLREQKLLPVRIEDSGRLLVAIADAGNEAAIQALAVATGRDLELLVASADDIEAAIDRMTSDEVIPDEADASAAAAGQPDDLEQLKDLALGAPVIRLVNQLLIDALHTRATDIHLEPTRRRLIVRLRIDGILREIRSPPLELARAIASRVKILSGLDIAERRLPQDGRARVSIEGRQIELRVATLPTVNGEAVAIRLLENAQRALDLRQLGFDEPTQATLRRHLSAPHGLVLVTGPTGSGKTTTLATALTILNEPVRKILTIEDPVEYQLDGVNQVHVRPDIGLTFAHTLRSFLRNDPDVIMVGELRDTETARIAVQAALTGHLVLSTLHTNSAAGAITRLLDMGVESYLLASCLRCIIGQRLVRMLCLACRQPCHERIALPPDVLAAAGLDAEGPHPHYRAVGCARCFETGYIGRIGIVELIEVDEPLRRLVKPDVATSTVMAQSQRTGTVTMAVDGLRKCLAGITTPEEVRRVALEA
ncbi:MAG: ATPase, T2SS/T4P/T4SS family [Hyphomicrobiaceae bacterium]|nr:ATPase, T2SS/T4P/T4SS family [Hyphomicrobiaceae bacterium]